jgi:hypothetical protein
MIEIEAEKFAAPCVFANVQTDDADQWDRKLYEAFLLELEDIVFPFSLSAHGLLLFCGINRIIEVSPQRELHGCEVR